MSEEFTPPSGRASGEPPDESELRAALRAGAALYTAGEYHAAHDPWEAVWLRLDGPDERLFHGAIQLTAAIYHARDRNWSGAAGLAESAREYLALGERRRGVELQPLREFCRRLAADPSLIERRPPPAFRVSGSVVRYESLSPAGVALAAEALAEEEGYDVSVTLDAARFARADRARVERETAPGGEERGEPEDTEFTRFLRAFLTESARRGVVFDRLTAHVERRRREREDVRGLFE
ncbi:MAG: DUF309 domain-containing protein [Halobaculum sp.]